MIPINTLSTTTLSDRELHGVLDRTKEELTSAIQYLNSANEGPSDSTCLRGRVEELEGQLLALEHEVIDRTLHEQTAVARCPDLTPQPSSIYQNLPDELVDGPIFGFLTSEELAYISKLSMGGMAKNARSLLHAMVTELQNLASLHSTIQKSITWMSQNPRMGGLGQEMVHFQSHLQKGFQGIHASELQQLRALYESITERLSYSYKPSERQALRLIKTTLTKRLSESLAIIPELRNNPEVVLAAVQQNGCALQYASVARSKDPAIVLAAVQHTGFALRYASEELRNDPKIVLAAVQQYGGALEYASQELRNDSAIVLTAVQKNGLALQYASAALRNNSAIVLAAVQKNGLALQYASKDLCNDRKIVLAAVQQNGRALQYAGGSLRGDPGIVLAAIEQSGLALQYASKEFRNDPEIVLAAVQQDGRALQYASEELRNHPEIVLAAVHQYGWSL